MIYEDRLTTANQVIDLVLSGHGLNLKIKHNRLYLDYAGANKTKSLLVRLRKNDIVFQSRRLPLGFTHECVVGLLVRWVRNEDCHDIGLWKQWCKLGLKPESIIDILIEAGYPEGEGNND